MVVGTLFFATIATAEFFGGTTVVIPVAMHGPGKLGTVWVTDVWIGNHTVEAKTLTLDFYPAGGGKLSETAAVGAYSVVGLKDVVLQTFGLDNVKGMLVLSVPGESRFSAQARIYNTGNPAGEFGQYVPGFGIGELGREGWVYGLSGVGGDRTNFGVANPSDTAFDVTATLKDAAGSSQGSRTIALSPHQLVQIDDIFAYFGVAPAGNMQLIISSDAAEKIFYAYASVVRDDTGDAVFMPGLAVNSGPY